jgi:hypothetical protein
MYADHSPIPNFPQTKSGQVLVLEKTDKDEAAVIAMARDEGAVSIDGDDDEIFWVVFSDEPRRVWDFTEASLRSAIRTM